MGDLHIDRLEKRATEKELIARPPSNKEVSLRRAELLRRRIEELDERLAILISERTLWQRLPR